MLMYRQIDPRRNVSSIKREQFPEHINVRIKLLDHKQKPKNKTKIFQCNYRFPRNPATTINTKRRM